MNELIKIKTNDDGKQLVSARELHEFLDLKKRFSAWIDQYIKENNDYMFVKDEDFTSVLSSTVVNNGANRELQDYAITISMAKEISMVTKTEKGKEARRYFIDCEKKLKEIANRPSYQIEDEILRAERWIEEEKERRRLVLEIEKKEEIIEDITTHTLTIEESRKVIRRLVGSLAKNVFHNHYDKTWNALYRQLNYNLDVRVRRRNKGKRESLLDTLTEEETYELEKIARNLCVVHNISIEEALSLKNFRIN